MINLSLQIPIDVDTTRAEAKLNELENKRQKVEDDSVASFNKVMSMARAAYSGISAVVRIGGGTMGQLFQTIVSGALGAATSLYPLLHAAMTAGLASLNPYQVAMAIAGMAELGISIAAITAQQLKQTEINSNLRAGLSLINSVQSIIGSLNFL